MSATGAQAFDGGRDWAMGEGKDGGLRGTIRRGAMICAAIAAAVLAFYSIGTMMDRLGKAQDAEQSIDLAAFANVLLDDLNRERSEAIYVAAAGIDTPTEFNARARTTDDTIGVLTNALLPAGGGTLGPVQENTARHALDVLANMQGLRDGVRSQSIGPARVSQGYGAIMDRLIADMGLMLGRLADGNDSVTPGFAALARLDDQVGLETGLGFTGFALGSMPAELHPLFHEAIAAQTGHRLAFLGAASVDDASALDRVLGLAEQSDVLMAREALHASAGGTVLDASHRLAWSRYMKAKETDLTVLRSVFVRDHLQLIAQGHRDVARSALFSGLVGLVLIVLALGAALLATRARPARLRAGAAPDMAE